jgi:hypothetical protein
MRTDMDDEDGFRFGKETLVKSFDSKCSERSNLVQKSRS